MALLQIYRKNVTDPIGIRVEKEDAEKFCLSWVREVASGRGANSCVCIGKFTGIAGAIDAIEIVED